MQSISQRKSVQACDFVCARRYAWASSSLCDGFVVVAIYNSNVIRIIIVCLCANLYPIENDVCITSIWHVAWHGTQFIESTINIRHLHGHFKWNHRQHHHHHHRHNSISLKISWSNRIAAMLLLLFSFAFLFISLPFHFFSNAIW